MNKKYYIALYDGDVFIFITKEHEVFCRGFNIFDRYVRNFNVSSLDENGLKINRKQYMKYLRYSRKDHFYIPFYDV